VVALDQRGDSRACALPCRTAAPDGAAERDALLQAELHSRHFLSSNKLGGHLGWSSPSS
jgi:hypothetical protein